MSLEESLHLQGYTDDHKFRVFTHENPLFKGDYLTKVLRAGTPDDIQSLFEARYSSKDEAIEGHKIVLFVLNTKMYHALYKIAHEEDTASSTERQLVHNLNGWHTGGA